MNIKIESMLIASLLLIILFVAFLFGAYFERNNLYYPSTDYMEKVHYLDCSNRSLKDSIECLQFELKGFYNYNLSNRGEDLTLEELKSRGGVCWHYSEWYGDNAEDLGFNSEQVVIWINKSAGDRHQFTVVSNEEGYCVVDQTMDVKCFYLDYQGSTASL